MKILALNTANILADIALVKENQVVLKKVDSNAKHSESFMLALDEILQQTNLKPTDFDVFAGVVGPGSFTGIRIGISIIKGFEMVNRAKLVAVSTFELMAKEFLNLNPNFSGEFICVLDALSGKFYTQKFSTTGKVFAPVLHEGKEEILKEQTRVGSKDEKLDFATFNVAFSTEVLKEITMQKVEAQEFVDSLTPLYLRKSQAEDELEKREKNVWNKTTFSWKFGWVGWIFKQRNFI